MKYIFIFIFFLLLIVYFWLILKNGYYNYIKLPKNIFCFWDKGYDSLPDIGKICIHSWIKHNPEYNIIILNKKNIYNYLDKDILDFIWTKNQIQTQSDLIRINLLSKHGGIWIDMTLFCTIPLRKWLPYNMKSNVFLFKYRCNDCKDLGLASWFIVSGKNNYLINTIANKYNEFWKHNSKSVYFNFHIIAKYNIYNDTKCLDIFRNIPYINGHTCRMNMYGITYTHLYLPMTYNIKNLLESNIPLFKFNWNHRESGVNDDISILLYKKNKKLFKKIPNTSTLIYYLKSSVENI